MKINKTAFKKMIQEDIEAIKMHFPRDVDKLEKEHIIQILNESVDFYYPKQEDRERDKTILREYTRFLRENDYFGTPPKNLMLGYVGEFNQQK